MIIRIAGWDDDFSPSACLTFFRSADRGLQVPANLKPEPTKHEARKRRASERHVVGCSEELGSRALLQTLCAVDFAETLIKGSER